MDIPRKGKKEIRQRTRKGQTCGKLQIEDFVPRKWENITFSRESLDEKKRSGGVAVVAARELRAMIVSVRVNVGGRRRSTSDVGRFGSAWNVAPSNETLRDWSNARL